MKELEKIYRKRKKQLLPIALGFTAMFIIFRVIIPQWEDVSEVRDLLTTKSATVEAKEKNLQLLSAMPDEKVDGDFELATTALPSAKDIVLIYTELINVASRSNVSLGGFTVSLGGIYSTDVKEVTRDQKSIIGVPILTININVSGQNSALRLFAEELYKSVPLVEIVGVNMSEGDARYEVNFFYKPITLRPSSSVVTALEPLNQNEINQLSELSEWRDASL